ncbi:hypothetical protein CBS101457_005062 [Exobasidium rhododendri]|nr:hypothetical protein CBS101457_005062 [Exobasidium rhododendri]
MKYFFNVLLSSLALASASMAAPAHDSSLDHPNLGKRAIAACVTLTSIEADQFASSGANYRNTGTVSTGGGHPDDVFRVIPATDDKRYITLTASSGAADRNVFKFDAEEEGSAGFQTMYWLSKGSECSILKWKYEDINRVTVTVYEKNSN